MAVCARPLTSRKAWIPFTPNASRRSKASNQNPREEPMYKTLLLGAASAVAMVGAAAAQTGPIQIGVVTPLTGTYAGIGQQVRWGLELATKEINAAGGIAGRQINLTVEDEEANPAVATQKAERLF